LKLHDKFKLIPVRITRV